MARPKRIPAKKAPVKRTRRKDGIDPSATVQSKVPEAWIDEQLRKECLQIATANGSSISTLVKDAEAIYLFVKGSTVTASVTYSLPESKEKTQGPRLYDYPVEEPVIPEPSPRLSKLDAHTL